MSNIAIKVENLSKAYQLGEIGTGTLSQDLERWWAKVRGKEDPFLRIGETNNRALKGDSNIVWSLKDINFSIEKGDTVGIIGRNGAGKSTLLKILSRVTTPTSGKIIGLGRIASLLEVGTGFHPELTGRENIYLNGAIMGMRKREIQKKFDEIVEFAGVNRYIDTPVKRYSSGMYVRLAFAVAAHLDSEILIVDEVLAVGDAEFQKKCLGKMGDVSKSQGKTVLFVSHNMGSIEMLCKNCFMLNMGVLQSSGTAQKVINEYNNLNSRKSESFKENNTKEIFIKNATVKTDNNTNKVTFSTDERIVFTITVQQNNYVPNTNFLFFLRNQYESRLFMIEKNIEEVFDKNTSTQSRTIIITLPNEFLMPSNYTCEIGILTATAEYIDYHESILPFEVIYGKTSLVKYGQRELGYIFPAYTINIEN